MYVKDFDFNAKPCNYSTGGRVSRMEKREVVATPTSRRSEETRKVAVKAPARRSVPVASREPVLSRLAAVAAPEAPVGLKKGGMAKVGKVMGEFKAGKLHSGSKKGPAVTSRKQAVAIALSEAAKAKKG
jgi:hypothetical protein